MRLVSLKTLICVISISSVPLNPIILRKKKERKPLLKIHYNNCYIQIPSDNVEILKLASAAPEFFTDYFKNKEKTLETTTQ
jgi:hypothetical protein